MVEFYTTFELTTSQKIQIQVIGKPESISTKAQPEPRCYKKKDCTETNADAFALFYTLPPGKNEIRIKASPIANYEKEVPGLNIQLLSKGYTWHNLSLKISQSYQPLTITTADDVALTDARGRPTKNTEDLGLLPLIGYGPESPYYLSGILAKSFLPPDMEKLGLTINSKFQTIAQQTLEKKINEYWPETKDVYSVERRGAVVIVNAKTGAILASANHPVPPPGVHPWDIASFNKLYHKKSPLFVRGWQGLDKNNAPGSTFKTVVALAAIETSNNNPDIEKYIDGFNRSQFSSQTGLPLNCAYYYPYEDKCSSVILPSVDFKISNFGKPPQPLSNVFTKSSVFGLKEAVRDSVNVWFAHLGVLMDGEKALKYDMAMKTLKKDEPLPAFPAFHLVQFAQHLGFGKGPMDLAIYAPAGIVLSRTEAITHGDNKREGDVLYGHTGQMNLMNHKQRILLFVLAQNSIGQAMETTPLQMAKVAATIAAERKISPYLIDQWGQIKVAPPEGEALGISSGLLKEGMKAVTKLGTASKEFKIRSYKEKVYGKTGTAEVKPTSYKPRHNTAWFIGWYEEQENEPEWAFACMVTHAYGNHGTGGAVCASIVAEILDQLI